MLAPEVRVILFTRLGKDHIGGQICATLQDQRIELPLSNVPGKPTSFSYIVSQAGSGRGTIFSEAGVRAEPVPMHEIEREMDGAEVLWLVAPTRNDLIRPAIELAAQRRLPVFFGLGIVQIDELGYEGLVSELAGPIDMFACNCREAERLTRRTRIVEQLGALRFGGVVRTVVITDGANGIHGLRDGKMVHVPAYMDERRVIDDTGAGDAAQGTIGHLLLSGMDLEEALRGGARQGFECCTATGAQTMLLDATVLRQYLTEKPATEAA